MSFNSLVMDINQFFFRRPKLFNSSSVYIIWWIEKLKFWPYLFLLKNKIVFVLFNVLRKIWKRSRYLIVLCVFRYLTGALLDFLKLQTNLVIWASWVSMSMTWNSHAQISKLISFICKPLNLIHNNWWWSKWCIFLRWN